MKVDVKKQLKNELFAMFSLARLNSKNHNYYRPDWLIVRLVGNFCCTLIGSQFG